MRRRGFRGICAQLMTAAMLFTGTMAGTMTGAVAVSAETVEDAEAVSVEAVEEAEVVSAETVDGAEAPSYQSNIIKDANGKTVDLGGIVVVIGDYYSDPWEQVYAKMCQDNPEKAAYIDWIQETYNFRIKQELYSYYSTINSDFVDYQTKGGDSNNYVFILTADYKIKSYIDCGLIYNLSTLDCLDFNKAKFAGNELADLYSKNGSYYVMNTDGPGLGCGMYFNRRILQESGIDPDSLYTMQANGTWTWSAWEDMMDKVQKHYADSQGNVTVAGFDANLSVAVEEAIFSNNGTYVSKTNGKYTSGFETTETKQAIEWMIGVIDNYSLEEPEGCDWTYYRDAFLNGECAFVPEGHYQMITNNSFASMTEPYGFVAFPKGPKASDYTNVWTATVSVIPSCYSQQKAWNIAFAYDLFTDADVLFPDKDTTEYASQIDKKAVTETLPLLASKGTYSESMLFDLQLGSNLLWSIGRGTTMESLQNKFNYIRSLIEEDYEYTEVVKTSPIHYYYITNDGVHVVMDNEGTDEVFKSLPPITAEDELDIYSIPNETVANQFASGAIANAASVYVNLPEDESISLGNSDHVIGSIYNLYVMAGKVDVYAEKIDYFTFVSGTANINANVGGLDIGRHPQIKVNEEKPIGNLQVNGNVNYITHYKQVAAKGGYYGNVTVSGTVGGGRIYDGVYDENGKYVELKGLYDIGKCATNTFKITGGVYDSKVSLTEITNKPVSQSETRVTGTYAILGNGVTLRFVVQFSDEAIAHLVDRHTEVVISSPNIMNVWYSFYDENELKPIADSQNSNVYYFDVVVDPAYMTDEYTIFVYMDDEDAAGGQLTVANYNTTLKKYLNELVSDSNYYSANRNSSDFSEKYRAYIYQVAIALQNYGLACQEYFNHNAAEGSWIIDPGTRLDLSMVNTAFAAESYRFDSRTTPDKAQYCDACTLRYLGKTLVLEEKVYTRLYFYIDIPEDTDLKELFVYDSFGNSYDFEGVTDNIAFVDLCSESITSAGRLEYYKVVHIGNETVEHSFSVSNFDCCDYVLNSPDVSDSLKTLIQSYVYYANKAYEYMKAMTVS